MASIEYEEHCYADKLIHDEILYLYNEIKKMKGNRMFSEGIYSLVYILERLIFIEDYYNKITDTKRSEFPHYKKDNGTVVQIDKAEILSIYSKEISTYKNFMTELSNATRNDIAHLLKLIHILLGLNEPSDIWHGIKMSDTEYFWHSRNSNNEKMCVRYLVNIIKHCYSLRAIMGNNGNALAYSLRDLSNIFRSCDKLITKYYITE